MIFSRLPILAGWLALSLTLNAEPPRDLNKIIPVQKAIAAGRQALRENDPARAVNILEAEQANAVGNTGFDALLKQAREAVEAVNKDTAPATVAAESPKRSTAPATLAPPLPPPPPVDEPIRETGPAPEPLPLLEPEPKPLPVIAPPPKPLPVVAPPKPETDPFQQTPTHRKLPRTDTPAPAPAPVAVVAKRNFVLKGVTDAGKEAELLDVANSARLAMYQRWSGATPNDWNTPCEITLHSCGKDYNQATHKPESLTGHATVAVRAGDVVSRRLDLCADDPALLDVTLPNELTQLILMEMFAEQPLPKWALVGMAALSETPESVARYRRTVPNLLRDRKLLTLSVLMEQQSFPEAEATTAFYAQSISLVGFLVEKKGCKAFAAFLREAPRRGVARALQSHYGFKDVADLQGQWLKSLTAVQ